MTVYWDAEFANKQIQIIFDSGIPMANKFLWEQEENLAEKN